MRSARVALGFVAACAGSRPPPAAAPSPVPPPARDGVLDSKVTTDHDATHIRALGKGVPIAELPIADRLGLPLRGKVDVDVDLTVPIVGGQEDYRRATGAVELTCPGGCTIGDDVARLHPGARSAATAALAGEGVAFGHVTFDHFNVRIVFANGRADVTQWLVDSPDVELEVALHVELGQTLAASTADGCLHFKPSATLGERDPRTAAVLATTGAPLGPGDQYNIRIQGPLDNLARLGQVCSVGAASE